jgi:NAD-dependent deacetylase
LKCWNGCGQPTWVATEEVHATDHEIPACPSCGDLARPAVVWFGESLDPADVTAALGACHCDLFLTIGTSAIVYPAAGLVEEAKRRGAFTVEVNPDETPASPLVDLSIRGPSEEVLPMLARIAPG